MLFNNYFALSEVTEPSKLLHRWCAMSLIAGVVKNNVWVNYGSVKLYPNLYIVLLGTISSKYPAAIEMLKAVYATSQKDVKIGTAQAIWEALEEVQPTDKILEAMFEDVIPDLSTFVNGITECNRDLGILQEGWGHEGFLDAPGKNKKIAKFITPRLNLLLSTTPDAFAQIFPANNTNTHLLSQLVIIHGGNPRKKIAWPESYSPPLLATLKSEIAKIAAMQGEMKITEEAKEFLKVIYNKWVPISDSRLMAYASHRHIQLIKCSMIVACERYSMEINKPIVQEAAKILSFAESKMPLALGEYGIDKQSYIRGRIMHLLNSRFPETSTLPEIFKAVQQDVKNFTEVADIVNSLVMADKIVHSNKSFAPVTTMGIGTDKSLHLDYSTLWESRA